VSTPIRVLLVEDEHEIADMLELFFSMQGYDFYHAGDGQEGLELASRKMPHVILMDIALPDTDGYALTVKLRWRPRTTHIPILFLSKWDSRDERLMGLSLGGDDYLAKPFDLQELLLRIQNSMARAARDHLTDLRTGLPAAFMARDLLEKARTDPNEAIIEISLENGIPYRNVYGSTSGADISQVISQLLLGVLNEYGSLEDFIGYLDEDQYVIITAQTNAHTIAEHITAAFHEAASRLYSAADRERGAILDGDTQYPLMRLLCRITAGALRTEVASSG